MGIYSGDLYQSTVTEDQEFLNLVQYSFLSHHVPEPTGGEYVVDQVFTSQRHSLIVSNYVSHWGVVVTTWDQYWDTFIS